MRLSSKTGICVTVTALSVLSAFSAPVASSTDDPSRDVNKLMIVDCMLPGKIMRLGAGARYMSARRPIKTTGADCEIRGGEYVAFDRSSYASSLKVWLPDAKAGNPKAQNYVGEMFESMLRQAAGGLPFAVWLRERIAAGADHPVALNLPESEYLKVVLLQRA